MVQHNCHGITISTYPSLVMCGNGHSMAIMSDHRSSTNVTQSRDEESAEAKDLIISIPF